MNLYFGDTFYFLALSNANDVQHGKALNLSRAQIARIITTTWVLTELADALCSASKKGIFIRLYRTLQQNLLCTIIPISQALFEKGLDLYSRRLDKDWSLTDCISFVVMREQGVTEALTGDRHFEQAGFKALLV